MDLGSVGLGVVAETLQGVIHMRNNCLDSGVLWYDNILVIARGKGTRERYLRFLSAVFREAKAEVREPGFALVHGLQRGAEECSTRGGGGGTTTSIQGNGQGTHQSGSWS